MKLGKTKVEQIIFNKVVEDYGEILSPTEISKIIQEYFYGSSKASNNTLNIEYNGSKYAIYFKNISYLGNPHPIYKKRIQIPKEFKNVYSENLKNGVQTLLIGVYKYKSTILFCDFDTTKYIKNKTNNSSAHVYTIDLLNGYRNGIFTKKDKNKNEITVFDTNHVEQFFELKNTNKVISGVEIFNTLDEFFASLKKEWFGIDCYSEMVESGFNNALQPEWPGFYLEYEMEKFIKQSNKKDVVKYSQNKKKGDIDLDLFFPKQGIYGDLKAHNLSTDDIQGNDYETVMDLLNHQSIYYVVCNHNTIKDSDKNYEVTEYWNTLLGKENLRSYGKRMKHSVSLKSYYVLELNKYNKKYIKIYKQGKNSDGKPREPKIMIKDGDINNFLVHIVEFENEE